MCHQTKYMTHRGNTGTHHKMCVVQIHSDHSHRTRLHNTISVLRTYIYGEFVIKIIMQLRIGIFNIREVEVQLTKNKNGFKQES